MTTSSRRSLRSNPKLVNNIPTDPSAIMARSKKRKAEDIEKYSCSSCATDKPARLFPDYNPSPDCEHLINTCKHCLRKWVEASIEAANFKTGSTGEEGIGSDGRAKAEVWGVGCPECESVMRAVNVDMAVPKKVFRRFDELERKHIGDTTPNWRWCLAPDCRGGQVHVPIDNQPQPQEPPMKRRKRGSKAPKKATQTPADEPDIMICNSCSARACVRCDRPMHEGETCTAYQARIKDRLDEEDKALKEVQKVSRPCPGCSKNIQKNGGCSYMNCSQCGTNFCWACQQAFIQGMYCKCRPAPPTNLPPATNR